MFSVFNYCAVNGNDVMIDHSKFQIFKFSVFCFHEFISGFFYFTDLVAHDTVKNISRDTHPFREIGLGV